MYYRSILGGNGQDPFLFFFRNRVTSREFAMKGDKGLLWEGCKTCFFPPTKFCLIIMMHDQLWFNSYMWRKEQDTQTNQQTHTHTSSSMHEMCLLTQYIEKFLKYSFILAKCFCKCVDNHVLLRICCQTPNLSSIQLKSAFWLPY